jgi:succinoglycan biosynthesis protein ExoV
VTSEVSTDGAPYDWGAVRAVWYRGEGLSNWTDDNFGDGPLNRYLLPMLFPSLRADVQEPSACLLGIGSLLGMWRELSAMRTDAQLLVFGSGFQYGTRAALPADSRVFCVRGRMSAEALGLTSDTGIADPAVLLPRFLPRDRDARSGRRGRFHKWDYGVVSLRSVAPRNLARTVFHVGQRARLLVTDARGEDSSGLAVHTSRTGDSFLDFLRRLWACEHVETDAFHVAVAADAYGIPWRPLRWEFKWQDHFSMLGIAERPTGFVLSQRPRIERAQQLLLERRDTLADFVNKR